MLGSWGRLYVTHSHTVEEGKVKSGGRVARSRQRATVTEVEKLALTDFQPRAKFLSFFFFSFYSFRPFFIPLFFSFTRVSNSWILLCRGYFGGVFSSPFFYLSSFSFSLFLFLFSHFSLLFFSFSGRPSKFSIHFSNFFHFFHFWDLMRTSLCMSS